MKTFHIFSLNISKSEDNSIEVLDNSETIRLGNKFQFKATRLRGIPEPKKHGIPSLIHTLVTTRTISKRFFLIKWKTI